MLPKEKKIAELIA
jgi:hypothetical protein